MGFPRIPTHVSGLPGKATSGEEAAAYESGGMGTVLSDWAAPGVFLRQGGGARRSAAASESKEIRATATDGERLSVPLTALRGGQ